MGLYIQIKEKGGLDVFNSPILYCHSDEKRCKIIVEEWKKWMLSQPKTKVSTPLSRLEPQTAMVDLLKWLTGYFFSEREHITGMFRLINEHVYVEHKKDNEELLVIEFNFYNK